MNNKHYRNMRVGRIMVLGMIASMAFGSVAAYAQQGTMPAASDVGRSTRDWLVMQGENRAAASTQPLLGDVASLVYQRYLDSFKNKIPESMSTQLGASGGMQGGGQGAQ
ncbi:DUF3613 domain-containing protein [Burkholderia sp. Bp8994]|uniref:DUF3613 domain-containing protein n=1 Tax=unclassified Burkholderia TaxID=2613784 RepID=UPI000F58DF92|nr:MULTISPECIES: DUF3613 domain-containing protein [unclassified Burkholderia]RQR37485.1 DUF3613 domain-containing protein [Burkholderia sp. Bp9131]RQR67510.1 DUF3613 domain-containing protein [Burkholderia sp. Bp9015]RQS00203.1 DUF3613 domain-containing protein [Burkholderia sp. Bp8994]RQS34356.1 DUF3613 domain-containing protein [Burkholderia sp. Bp8990]RQZ38975.1 DUF3613 domain-containing protein [Burkholderia sp. Bp9099]